MTKIKTKQNYKPGYLRGKGEVSEVGHPMRLRYPYSQDP